MALIKESSVHADSCCGGKDKGVLMCPVGDVQLDFILVLCSFGHLSAQSASKQFLGLVLGVHWKSHHGSPDVPAFLASRAASRGIKPSTSLNNPKSALLTSGL